MIRRAHACRPSRTAECGPGHLLCRNAGACPMPPSVLISEVGPRDGLQNEDLILSTSQKVQLINALVATGLQQIEVGSFVHPRNVPQMADTSAVFAQIKRRPGVIYSAIAPNTTGAQHAVAAGADYVAFGSCYGSATKPHAVRCPLTVLTQATHELPVPIVAIGGITAENAPALLRAGAGLLAVIAEIGRAHV